MAFDLRTSMQRALVNQNSAPSKRQVRNKSGKAGRRTYNGQMVLARVGGYGSTMEAIYAPAGTELCVVVPDSMGRLSDGTPRREPRW